MDEFDTENLFKVRLSIGPLNIRRPVQSHAHEEDISCTLDLISSEKANALDFTSTIHKTLSKKADSVAPQIPQLSTPPPQMPVEMPVVKKERVFNRVVESPSNLKSTTTTTSTVASKVESTKHVDELMFMIDNTASMSASSNEQKKPKKSALALEEIRSKVWSRSDRLTSSASVMVASQCVYTLVLSVFVTMFLF